MDDGYIGALADDSDRASVIEATFNADALRDARRKAQPETHPDFDGKHCVDCGDEIPEARLALGRVRCIECQSEIEFRRKLSRF